MLTFPENTRTLETRVIKMARAENGILYVAYKKTAVRTVEDLAASLQVIRQLIGEGKACIIADVTNLAETSFEVKRLLAERMHEITRALAIISGSAMGKMVANLFFSLYPQPFPIKMFNDQTTASEWLSKYLEH